MKVVELLKIGQNLMKTLQKACIRIEDIGYICMYDEYQDLIKNGNKKSYVVALLSEKYGISERKVYYLLKRFDSDCKIDAE